jgi:peroxiredoxin
MGQIYSAMDRTVQAEQAYFYGYTSGTPEAGDSLRGMFDRQGKDYSTRMRELSGQVFEEAPEFTGTTLEGKEVALSDFRGKVVVLNFWFIGCRACVLEEESLARLTKDIDAAQTVLIGLSRDDIADVRKYIEGDSPKGHDFYHMQLPGAADAAKAYNIRAFPTHVIIDRYGRITSKFSGGSSLSDAILKPMIEAAEGY